MQISKIVTTVVTTICASTAIAAPTEAGISNDIAPPPPPPGGNVGNGINNCGQDEFKGWQTGCCVDSTGSPIECVGAGGGLTNLLGGLINVVVSITTGDDQEAPCHDKPDQILCCNNIGSGTQTCINNSGDKIKPRSINVM